METLHKIKENRFYASITYLPVPPFISDSKEDLEVIIKTQRSFVEPLTLYGSGKDLYYNILRRLPKYKKPFKSFNQPEKAHQVMLERTRREFCEKYEVRYKIIYGQKRFHERSRVIKMC